CGDARVADPSPAGVTPRPQAVTDCVTGWLQGEVQEFRDGVRREIAEFRDGFAKLRRGLTGLGTRLRGPDSAR
ncbi:MAG: hypothetical protein ACREJG_06955, partial [Candidatus Rokuibacteriota bacterium]